MGLSIAFSGKDDRIVMDPAAPAGDRAALQIRIGPPKKLNLH
jgi:hypothetical protein